MVAKVREGQHRHVAGGVLSIGSGSSSSGTTRRWRRRTLERSRPARALDECCEVAHEWIRFLDE